MHFGFMHAVLLYSNNRHVSATHVSIFRVVSARIQIYLRCIRITARLFIYFWLKFRVIGKTVMSIKYHKLKIVVCSVVLWRDIYRRHIFGRL